MLDNQSTTEPHAHPEKIFNVTNTKK
jgi:hypothetical protein